MKSPFHRLSHLFVISLFITALFFSSNLWAGELLKGRGDTIPNQYIVILKSGLAMNMTFESASSQLPEVARLADDLISIHGAYEDEVFIVYENAVEGFAIRMDAASAKAMADDPRVLFIEPDGMASIDDIQQNATWGIDRVDQKSLPLSKSYEYNTKAANVHVYILDTGLNASHTEFTGRVGNGFDAVGDGGGTDDQNGHGTHVAGTVAGTKYGIAKGATIHPVQVLNSGGSASWSTVIKGIDWVTQNHQKPAVANMSLGGGVSSSINKAVENSIAAGVTYAVAAGNSNKDACNYSPASVATALTVGSTTSSDARSSFSNWGSCVSIMAPGSSILSASHTSNNGTSTKSGTSMASPHVCGVAALYLANNPDATPKEVKKALTDAATPDKISDVKGSPNKLLYSIFSSGPVPTVNADFDFRVNQLSVSFTDKSTATQATVDGWLWSFGDGGRSNLQNPTHAYTKAGTYTVTLTASAGATSDRISQSITVKEGSSNQISFDGFESKNFRGGEGWLRKSWKKTGDVRIIEKKPFEGKYYVRMRKNTGYLKRTVRMSNIQTARLKFAARARAFEDGDKAYVKVSNDNVTYTVVKEFTISDSDNQYHTFDIDLKDFLPATTLRVVFESAMSGNKDYLYLDNIEITK